MNHFVDLNFGSSSADFYKATQWLLESGYGKKFEPNFTVVKAKTSNNLKDIKPSDGELPSDNNEEPWSKPAIQINNLDAKVIIEEVVNAIVSYDLLKGFEIAGKNYGRPIETYILAAFTYFVICFSLSRAAKRIQQKVAIIR